MHENIITDTLIHASHVNSTAYVDNEYRNQRDHEHSIVIEQQLQYDYSSFHHKKIISRLPMTVYCETQSYKIEVFIWC